jgi:heme oxygenase
MASKQYTFKQALHNLPSDVNFDPLAMKTLNDLRRACLIQLDLIEEGQDGTEEDDPKAIRRWLRRYGRPQPHNP